MGDLFLALRRTEEGLRVFALVVSQVASIQNDQYAIVVHLGVVAWALPCVTMFRTEWRGYIQVQALPV